MTYRDPLAGLLSQVATKRGLAADRERRVSPVLRALLPEGIAARIAEHRPAAMDEPADSLESLSRVDAALDALLSTYEEALLAEDHARTLAFEVGDPPRPDIPPPWLIEEGFQLTFRSRLAEEVAVTLDDETTLLRWGDFGYLVRFRYDGAPHVLHVEARLDSSQMSIASYVATLRTTMPPRAPELELAPQGPHHTVGRALGLVRELDTGSQALDEAFWIKGDREALAFLDRDLEGALLSMLPRAPKLRIHAGSVALSWKGASTGAAPLRLDLALGITRRLHALVAEG